MLKKQQVMDFLDSNVSGCARLSASELGSALTGTESLNFNSVENVPGIEAREAFTVSSSSVFKVIGSPLAQQEHVDIVPTIIDDTLSYVPWQLTSIKLSKKIGECHCVTLSGK